MLRIDILMIKNYFTYLIFAVVVLFCSDVVAQNSKPVVTQKTELNFYPNPVVDGKIFITSTTGATINKEVEIFDVLGKLVLKATVVRELSLSSLNPGVYLIKIKENDFTATRKLIIK